MKTIDRFQATTLAHIIETGQLINELENEFGICQRVSSDLTEAVSILSVVPVYWRQSEEERISNAVYLNDSLNNF